MKSNKNILAVLIVMVAIAVSTCGCKSTEETAPTESVEEMSAYPAGPYEDDFTDSVDSGYPGEETYVAEESIRPDTITVPDPSPDSGVVAGILFGKTDNLPYIAPELYLGKLIPSNDEDSEVPPLISLSTGSDPQATQANDGSFVFTDVPPGEYILIVWSPMSLVPIIDPETQAELLVIVAADEILDLGTVFVE